MIKYLKYTSIYLLLILQNANAQSNTQIIDNNAEKIVALYISYLEKISVNSDDMEKPLSQLICSQKILTEWVSEYRKKINNLNSSHVKKMIKFSDDASKNISDARIIFSDEEVDEIINNIEKKRSLNVFPANAKFQNITASNINEVQLNRSWEKCFSL